MSAQVAPTERDLDLLLLVGLCRYVSVPQIAREFFPSLDRARRRVRQLFDGGYVTVSLVTSTAPNVVALARRGLDVLRAERPEAAARAALAGTIRLSEVPRHLGVVDLRLFAAAVGAARGTPLVRWSGQDGAALAAYGFGRHRLDPDGLAELETASGTVAVACELDRPHGDPAALARRLGRYGDLADEGRVDALWLLVTASPSRALVVREAAAAAGLGGWTRVLTDADVAARPARLPSSEDRAEGPGCGIAHAADPGAPCGVRGSAGDGDGPADGTADRRGEGAP